MKKEEKVFVYFVGAGPGDPGLLTIKGKEMIEKAEVIIYAGSLVNDKILCFARKDAKLHDSAGMNLEEIMKIMLGAVAQKKMVVRLHSGDPGIYGSIGEQIFILEEKGIPCRVVPGVSSALAGAAVLKKELTNPGLSQTVIFTRLEGRTPVPAKEKLSLLAGYGATMCIFLSVGMLSEVVTELSKGYLSETPVIVIEKVSLPEERIIRGNLENIVSLVKKAGITKTALIMVGEVFGEEPCREQTKSKLYDKEFSHGFRKGGSAS